MKYQMTQNFFNDGPAPRVPFYFTHATKYQKLYNGPAVYVPLGATSAATIITGLLFISVSLVVTVAMIPAMLIAAAYLIFFAYFMSQPLNKDRNYSSYDTNTKDLIINEYWKLSKSRRKQLKPLAKDVNVERNNSSLTDEWKHIVRTYVEMDQVSGSLDSDQLQKVRNKFEEDKKLFEIMQENGWTDGTK